MRGCAVRGIRSCVLVRCALCAVWCVVCGAWCVACGTLRWCLVVSWCGVCWFVCVASALLGWRFCFRVGVLGCVLVVSDRVGPRWFGLCWVRVGFRFVWLRRVDAVCVAVESAIPPPADPPFPNPILPLLLLSLLLLQLLLLPLPSSCS